MPLVKQCSTCKVVGEVETYRVQVYGADGDERLTKVLFEEDADLCAHGVNRLLELIHRGLSRPMRRKAKVTNGA